jgi:hypothetical protein
MNDIYFIHYRLKIHPYNAELDILADILLGIVVLSSIALEPLYTVAPIRLK